MAQIRIAGVSAGERLDPLTSLLMASMLSAFIALVFRLAGAKANLPNVWIALWYGIGPHTLLGMGPYLALFMATWSLVLHFYLAPRILNRMPRGARQGSHEASMRLRRLNLPAKALPLALDLPCH